MCLVAQLIPIYSLFMIISHEFGNLDFFSIIIFQYLEIKFNEFKDQNSYKIII